MYIYKIIKDYLNEINSIVGIANY